MFRLKKTWAKLKSSEMKTFESLTEVLQQKGNYKNLREHLHHLQPPCIPYLCVGWGSDWGRGVVCSFCLFVLVCVSFVPCVFVCVPCVAPACIARTLRKLRGCSMFACRGRGFGTGCRLFHGLSSLAFLLILCAPSPFLALGGSGMYLTDLTFIEDGNPDEINHLINFEKHRKVAEVIAEIQLYQQTAYNLTNIPEVGRVGLLGLFSLCGGGLRLTRLSLGACFGWVVALVGWFLWLGACISWVVALVGWLHWLGSCAARDDPPLRRLIPFRSRPDPGAFVRLCADG